MNPLTLYIRWCRGTESNRRHEDFQSSALPTELPRLIVFAGFGLVQAKLAKLSQRPYPVNWIPPDLISPEILYFFDIILKTRLVLTHLSPTVTSMLVLTRKIGESLAINDNVRITVLEVKGKTVRLGIEAPDDIKVYRQEILVKILEENRQAASAGKFDPSQVGRWAKDRLQS